MSDFVTKLGLFTALPVFILFIIEVFIRLDTNTFEVKADYLNENLDQIEVLFLGSSHVTNAISPSLLSRKAANLAYPKQTIELDSALLFHYAPKMKNLKLVIIESDYHRFEKIIDEDFFRIPWYLTFHGLEYEKVSVLHRISMFSTNPHFFLIYVANALNPFKRSRRIDSFGFYEEDFEGEFMEAGFDSVKVIKKNLARGIDKAESEAHFNINKAKLWAMQNFCEQHGLVFVLLDVPTYEVYWQFYNPNKLARKSALLDDLRGKSNVLYWNFEKDSRFSFKHFKDIGHLNTTGAVLFSKIVDEQVENVLSHPTEVIQQQK